MITNVDADTGEIISREALADSLVANPSLDVPIAPIFLRTAYNYDMLAASTASGLLCTDASLAVQSERDEVDINTIVERFGLTGKMPTNLRAPTYGDFTGVADMRQALEAIHYADQAFMEFPAHVRARFGNDPAAFVDFCSQEANIPEMEKMGLLSPKTAPPGPIEVRVVPPPSVNPPEPPKAV